MCASRLAGGIKEMVEAAARRVNGAKRHRIVEKPKAIGIILAKLRNPRAQTGVSVPR
jgi:hypothetical protein